MTKQPQVQSITYMISRSQVKAFLGFALLSGLGWICDFGTYTLLIEFFELKPIYANFISSYVGVTFVYFTSLKLVCDKVIDRHPLFLGSYWGFQFISILLYSIALSALVSWLQTPPAIAVISDHGEISGKIIITPLNLLSNFILMKKLTRFMSDKVTQHA
jgi:putative flippase GtrA